MALDHNWLTTLGLVTSSLIAVTANSLLLLVFFRRRGLRTVSNRFVINLLITNLLSSIFLVPLLIIDQESSSVEEDPIEKLLNVSKEITLNNGTATQENVGELLFSEKKEEIIVENDEIIIDKDSLEIVKIDYKESERNSSSNSSSTFLCHFAQITTNLICTTSIFSILLIGIDQYFAVIHPLRYHSYIDKCRSTMLLAGCWIFSITLAILCTCLSADSNFWKFCNKSDQQSTVFRTIYAYAYFVLVILVPFVTICIIYVCIYTAAHKSSERMRKSTSTNINTSSNSYAQLPSQVTKDSSEESLNQEDICRTLPKVHSAPNFINLENLQGENEGEKSETKTIDSSGTKVNRTSSERTGKNIIVSLKSRISNASVFKYREETRAAKISILVIFMVLICYSPYGVAVLLHGSKISFRFDQLSLILLVISNIISPFLFAYRNRRIQRELFKFLRLIPPKSIHQNSYAGKWNRGAREMKIEQENEMVEEPFLNDGVQIPQVIVQTENEKKSILKRVCSKNWSNYKKCNFITVPDSCLDTRGSFSSASTQISTEE